MSNEQHLGELRAKMREHNLDYYFVPHADAHQSEYVPEHLQRRDFISGFTGSAGDVLVGLEEAYLWTDGRYFLQAEAELDLSVFTLMKATQGMAPPIDQWLGSHVHNAKVGVDPTVLTQGQAARFQSALAPNNSELVYVDDNLVDAIREVPKAVDAPAFLAKAEFCGPSAKGKIAQMRDSLGEFDAMAINALDAVAWLFNIRGNDTPYNPLVISYAIVDKERAHWFVDDHKLDQAVSDYCHEQGIHIHPYGDIFAALGKYESVWIDPGFASAKMFESIQSAHVAALPIDLAKACKSDAELAATTEAHVKDAVALAKYFHWVENNWQGQTEYTAAERLEAFRAEDPDFHQPSFATISGYGPNGAVIHYHVHEESALPLNDDNLYLVDSGGQYWQGTTDITRVFHFGEPTAQQKKHYTLVLKGHLSLGRAIFAHGACGFQIDTFARQFLWEEGLDYVHGTGHGVGVFLCVHEGPQRISPGPIRQPVLPKMIVSNEPGVYLPGHYGIRIENLCIVKEVKPKDPYDIGVGPFYQLEDLTLTPYNAKLMDIDLLTQQELDQINAYHQRVWETVSPRLEGEVKAWLEAQTKPLTR